MGLVFDPERVGSGNIPAHADGQAQYDAAIVLGESLAELAREQDFKDPDLLAYMLYGSAIKYYGSEPNRRSDVDLLVVTNTFVETSRIHQAVRSRIEGVGPAFNVDVNPMIYSRQELEGDKRVNPFYAEHLSSVRGLVTHKCFQHFAWEWQHRMGNKYTDIDRALFGQLPFVEAWPFAVEYLKARRSQFQTQLDQVEPDLTALKGPFELPRNLGRTMSEFFMKYMADHTNLYDDTVEAETEEELADQIQEYNRPYHERLLVIGQVTGTSNLIEDDIMRLHELDSKYSGLLEAAMAGEISIDDYEKWLESVYVESLERAFKIADVTDAMVYRTVEMAKLDPNYDTLVVSEYAEDPYSPSQFVDVRKPAEEAGFMQIVPESYDIDRLVFTIAPRFPELARRYKADQDFQEKLRREDFEDYKREKAEEDARTTREQQ